LFDPGQNVSPLARYDQTTKIIRTPEFYNIIDVYQFYLDSGWLAVYSLQPVLPLKSQP